MIDTLARDPCIGGRQTGNVPAGSAGLRVKTLSVNPNRFHRIVLDKTIRDVQVAEQLLHQSGVAFEPLDSKPITRREEFGRHLEELVRLLASDTGAAVPRVLSPWRQTEHALGISESQRKAKLGVLRLDPDLLDQARTIPAEHAIQIARLDGRERQAELIQRSREQGLTCRQVQAAVDRLREDRALGVEQAIAAGSSSPVPPPVLAFDQQMAVLLDLCRQLVRLISNLRQSAEAQQAAAALTDLRQRINTFLEALL